MTEDPDRYFGRDEPVNENRVTAIVSTEPDGRLSIEAWLIINGKRAELFLPSWLAATTGDAQSIGREAIREAMEAFLKALGPRRYA
jgi:hypothetical protein